MQRPARATVSASRRPAEPRRPRDRTARPAVVAAAPAPADSGRRYAEHRDRAARRRASATGVARATARSSSASLSVGQVTPSGRRRLRRQSLASRSHQSVELRGEPSASLRARPAASTTVRRPSPPAAGPRGPTAGGGGRAATAAARDDDDGRAEHDALPGSCATWNVAHWLTPAKVTLAAVRQPPGLAGRSVRWRRCLASACATGERVDRLRPPVSRPRSPCQRGEVSTGVCDGRGSADATRPRPGLARRRHRRTRSGRAGAAGLSGTLTTHVRRERRVSAAGTASPVVDATCPSRRAPDCGA